MWHKHDDIMLDDYPGKVLWSDNIPRRKQQFPGHTLTYSVTLDTPNNSEKKYSGNTYTEKILEAS